jgi:hypothetical protein
MQKNLFAELMQSMTEALEHARGERELRTTVVSAAEPKSTTLRARPRGTQ